MLNKLITLITSLFITTSVLAQTDPNAKINLSMVSLADGPVQVGETFGVQIRMNAATTNQRYFVSDILFGWDTSKLEFLSVDHTGSHPLIWVDPSGLPCVEDENGNAIPDPLCSGIGDFYGVNEAMPPADGDAYYIGFGQMGVPFIVSNAEENIVILLFKAIDYFDTTEVFFIPEIDTNAAIAKTVVYGSYIPGLSVTGTLTNATIIGTSPIAGDFNKDGRVDPSDLSDLLSNWGMISFGENPYDLDNSGVVDAADLAILFGNWS